MPNHKQAEPVKGTQTKQSAMEHSRRSSEKKSPYGSPRSSICSSNASARSARSSVSSICSSDDTRSIESVATTTSIDSNDASIQETKPQGIRTIRRNGKDKTGKMQYSFALESGVVVPFGNFHKINTRAIARLTRLLNGSAHDKREQSDITKEFCTNHFIRLQKNGRTHLLIDLGEAQLSAFRSAW